MPATTVIDFVAALAAAQPPGNLFNPYGRSPHNPHNAARRHNLSHYLHQHTTATTLLIGEAPGYRGCRLTGIPFLSPAMIAASDNYQPIGEWPHIHGEASATILRRAIAPCQPPPLVWNVLPFHPHRPQQPQSNRTPTPAEVALGRPFLTHLLTLLPANPTLIAIGKQAARALTAWELPHTAVRHPAHGGKADFLTGLQQAGLLSESANSTHRPI